MLFIDFETNFELKQIIEYAIFDPGHNLLRQKSGEDCSKCLLLDLDDIFCNNETICFWHHFIPTYLALYHGDIYNKIDGRFITLTDAYAVFDGNSKTKYKIDEITSDLLNKEHLGNSTSDAIDLAKCYEELRRRMKSGK